MCDLTGLEGATDEWGDGTGRSSIGAYTDEEDDDEEDDDDNVAPVPTMLPSDKENLLDVVVSVLMAPAFDMMISLAYTRPAYADYARTQLGSDIATLAHTLTFIEHHFSTLLLAVPKIFAISPTLSPESRNAIARCLISLLRIFS